MFCVFEAGALTSTVTVPLLVVSPLRLSETPGIAEVTVLEVEVPATPLTVYWAFWPACASEVCSVSDSAWDSETWM